MAYGNYYNYQPNAYGNPYMQPQQQPLNNMPMYQQQNNIQAQNYIPMVYVSGIEGAKSYIVAPNSTVFLRDSENINRIYEKSADSQGKYTFKAFDLVDVNINEDKNNKTLSKKDIETFDLMSKSEFKAFKDSLSNDIDKLTQKVEKLLMRPLNKENKAINDVSGEKNV